MTTSASRPSSAARTAGSCPGRNPGKPNTSRSAAWTSIIAGNRTGATGGHRGSVAQLSHLPRRALFLVAGSALTAVLTARIGTDEGYGAGFGAAVVAACFASASHARERQL